MVENRPGLRLLRHLLLIVGVVIVALPVWIALVASTHERAALLTAPVPIWPGDQFWENYTAAWSRGVGFQAVPVWKMTINSMIMALSIALGKITISMLSAFAIVYFRFPFRHLVFWTIFVTLMLPVEVRIVPTYQVVADLNLLNSYTGLTLPLIASATATFLFRQFFMTIPPELVEAARIDGSGPMKFFRDILLPLSQTNIAALFVILFIYGWNQYLWPLLMTTDANYTTIVMSIQQMIPVAESDIEWEKVMAATVLAMLPPVLVVVTMQKLFVKGLVETEK